MSEYQLIARTGFGLTSPLAEEWEGFTVREDVSINCWWVSIAPGEIERLSDLCLKAFATASPEAGKFAAGRLGDSDIRILAAGDCQYLLAGAAAPMPDAIGKAAAVTEQSDGWVALWFSGQSTRDVMERLCGLELHPSAFPTGACARTPIEGMAAFIACTDAAEPRLLVLVQRSTARSFADHVRHAAASVCGGR